MINWRSRYLSEEDLPPGLAWQEEKPNADYRVKLAFAKLGGLMFRRLTYPNGASDHWQIERVL